MGTEGLIIALLVLVAAVAGLQFGVAVALLEIAVGAVAANYLGFAAPVWLPTFSEIGSLLLIFLAGSDVDVAFLRRRLGPVLLAGSASFLAPFLSMLAVGALFMDWSPQTRLLVAIASSSTSVAIVSMIFLSSAIALVFCGRPRLEPSEAELQRIPVEPHEEIEPA